jgi:hypothetical protein
MRCQIRFCPALPVFYRKNAVSVSFGMPMKVQVGEARTCFEGPRLVSYRQGRTYRTGPRYTSS